MFQIIVQIVFKCFKDNGFWFLIKLMDGIMCHDSLGHWNQSQTPLVISLPGELIRGKTIEVSST